MHILENEQTHGLTQNRISSINNGAFCPKFDLHAFDRLDRLFDIRGNRGTPFHIMPVTHNLRGAFAQQNRFRIDPMGGHILSQGNLYGIAACIVRTIALQESHQGGFACAARFALDALEFRELC